MILLDTHVIAWLHDDPDRRIPSTVRERLNRESLGVSPFVRLELTYLHEIGRISVPARTILDELRPKLELTYTNPSSAMICETATELRWTRDPFDRLLAAHAISEGMVLVTKDKTIRQHLHLAWWGD